MPPDHFRHDEVADMLQAIHQRLDVFVDPRHLDSTNPYQSLFERLDALIRLASENFQQLKELIMTTAAEFKQQQDDMAAEISKDTGIISSIQSAMNAQTALVQSLNDQIAALQSAGAGAISQADLDALAAEGAATLAAAQSNTATLSGLVPQNTAAAPAAAAEPQPAPAAAPAADSSAAPTT